MLHDWSSTMSDTGFCSTHCLLSGGKLLAFAAGLAEQSDAAAEGLHQSRACTRECRVQRFPVNQTTITHKIWAKRNKV